MNDRRVQRMIRELATCSPLPFFERLFRLLDIVRDAVWEAHARRIAGRPRAQVPEPRDGHSPYNDSLQPKELP